MVDKKAVVPTYRDTTLGQALQESLRELTQAGEINEATRDTIMSSFDVQVFEQFAQMPKTRPCKLTGSCPSYNNVDEVWKFNLKEMELKDDCFKDASDLCLVVSMNAKNNPIEAAPEEQTRNSRRGRGGRSGRN